MQYGQAASYILLGMSYSEDPWGVLMSWHLQKQQCIDFKLLLFISCFSSVSCKGKLVLQAPQNENTCKFKHILLWTCKNNAMAQVCSLCPKPTQLARDPQLESTACQLAIRYVSEDSFVTPTSFKICLGLPNYQNLPALPAYRVMCSYKVWSPHNICS